MSTNRILILAAILMAIGIGLFFLPKQQSADAAPSLASLSKGDAPWPAEIAHLQARLAAIGQPALSSEGTVIHIHQHLDIFVHGQKVEVPSGIGIHETGPAFIAPIHTHDASGIVHVEAPNEGPFTLGQFFDIWGVRLTPECLGGYCADEKDSLSVYVDGKRYQADPRTLQLSAHQEIVIFYGTSSELPSPLPSGYAFPEGY